MLSLIVIWPVRSRRADLFAATRRPLLRSAVGNTVGASDVDLVRSQHPGEIRMQPVVAHTRQHVAQFPDHPALAAVEKGEALRGVRDGYCLVIERAELGGGYFAARLDVSGQHGAPVRFVPLNSPQQVGARSETGRTRAFKRDPGAGAFGLKQFVEECG